MSGWSQQLILAFGEDEEIMKREFARLWARFPLQPLSTLALRVLSGDPSDNIARAYAAAEIWQRDLDVLENVRIFKQNGGVDAEDISLPTKEQIGKEIVALARDCTDPEEKLKGYKLYAELMGMVTKPETQVNVQVNNNKVMKVSDYGTDDDWEREAAAQQARLIASASVN